jgi:flagellar basal body-associated protein FliL
MPVALTAARPGATPFHQVTWTIMSDSTPAAPAAAEGGGAAPATPKAFVMVGVIVLALGAGAGGGMALAPRLLPRPLLTAADSAAAEPEPEAKAEHGKEGEGAEGKIFRLDNLIVNPAGSAGARFLMASVAFEVETEEAEQALKAHEVQIRDMVVSTLESQTMARLTQPGARDSLKQQLGHAVLTVLNPKTHVAVYLPQFVIQ